MNPFTMLWRLFAMLNTWLSVLEDGGKSAKVWSNASVTVSTNASTKWVASFEMPSEEVIEKANANTTGASTQEKTNTGFAQE